MRIAPINCRSTPISLLHLATRRRVPLAPAAIFLPLYKDWLPTKVPSELPAGPNKWPLEDAVRLVAGVGPPQRGGRAMGGAWARAPNPVELM